MSAFLFGLFGAVFTFSYLVWMLVNKRTCDRGIWQPSATSIERPGAYWYEVVFVGLFSIGCVVLAVDAIFRMWV